jgi:hypothetical protein
MTVLYDELHELFNATKRFRFPFHQEIELIPKNGVYLIFENGEKHQQWDRIVRVGTHTGNDQLRSRLYQHFLNPNKNRSIFRKNIGRCLLNKADNPYLTIWELDTTARANRTRWGHLIDSELERDIEKQISDYIQTHLSFTVIPVPTKDQRLIWESRIISTLAAYPAIKPSENWLGLLSPKEKIQRYGLWQVNELFNNPLTKEDYNVLTCLVGV